MTFRIQRGLREVHTKTADTRRGETKGAKDKNSGLQEKKLLNQNLIMKDIIFPVISTNILSN